MHDSLKPEYRTVGDEYRIARATGVALAKNDQPTAIERHNSRRRALDRQMHALVLETTKDGVAGGPFADWFYDLRRGQLRIYGALLRFIDLAHRTVPKAVLKMIPGWLSAYIDDLYDGTERPR